MQLYTIIQSNPDFSEPSILEPPDNSNSILAYATSIFRTRFRFPWRFEKSEF